MSEASTGSGSYTTDLFGTVEDPSGAAVANANVSLLAPGGQTTLAATTDSNGRFEFHDLVPGSYRLTAEASGFGVASIEVSVLGAQTNHATLQFVQISTQNQNVVVVASEPAALTPDPSERILVHDEVLEANPGRPGAPISIPGLPIETASGGIKAPQYFAPGVAGDHGEPIAQYFQIGDFLFPNNLPSNAHGNGYSDPNSLISQGIGAVQVDGGAFNVREGNHAVNLAAAYVPRDRLEPFLELTGDYRDVDAVAGWSPRNPGIHGWVGLEAAYGNGYLDRLEHRKQFKFNGYRAFALGHHQLTLFGIGYYGFSFIPGLIPRDVPVPGDTVDPRQSDRTHTSIFVATDTWQFTPKQQLQFSAFFRTYNLQLRSNFGAGLIQQSEFRTVAGGNATYLHKLHREISLLAGFDLRRDAPRDLDLKRADANGVFQPVTSNDLTLGFATPYVSLDGGVTRYFHYDIGVRQEEVFFDNADKINPQNSFNTQHGLTLPKGTFTILPPASRFLPVVSFSLGEGFHTNDPRIGQLGTTQGTILIPSHASQLVLQKKIYQTDVRITLARVTNAQELAKIDPDTGLQQDVGPSITKSITVSARRSFSFGYLQGSFARADAHDRILGQPVPEAPRLIWDAVGAINRLPFRLRARGEFEYVGRKFLGNDDLGSVLTAVPVREFRGSLGRSFAEGRFDLGVNFLLADGYTGQTVESLALPGETGGAFSRIVGVPLKSYVSASFAYRFGQSHRSSS
ncbi:MAG TPA: carboxypeptidase-like regulatory domain-containing protein [Terriglobales bacterium]